MTRQSGEAAGQGKPNRSAAAARPLGNGHANGDGEYHPSARPQASNAANIAEIVDLLVAKRMRLRRIKKGVSQQWLADQIGVAAQQVHKYECGISRVTAGRLSQIAEALEISINDLFVYNGRSTKRRSQKHAPTGGEVP